MQGSPWLIIYIPLIVILLLAQGFNRQSLQKAPGFPEEVEKVVKNSCYPCHTTESKNNDAISALDFNLWDEYSSPRKVSLLMNIDDVLEEGMMPPRKFKRRYPERALSDDQVTRVREWTQQEIKTMIK